MRRKNRSRSPGFYTETRVKRTLHRLGAVPHSASEILSLSLLLIQIIHITAVSLFFFSFLFFFFLAAEIHPLIKLHPTAVYFCEFEYSETQMGI